MGNIIVPEIFSPAVLEQMNTSIRIGRVAEDVTASVGAITQSGDTLHWPQINRNMKAVPVVKGQQLQPNNIDMKEITSQIKHMAVPFTVYDIENIQVNGEVLNKVVLGCGQEMARQIDYDLVEAIDADAVYKVPAAAADGFTLTEFYDAMACFKDSVDTDSMGAIIINSRLWPSFVNMPEFVKTDYTFQSSGNGFIKDGVIGYLFGVKVIICDNNTWDETLNECKTYVVKRGSLGYVFQRNIQIEQQRVIRLLATDIVVSSLYSTKLLDAKGAVIIRKTAV